MQDLCCFYHATIFKNVSLMGMAPMHDLLAAPKSTGFIHASLFQIFEDFIVLGITSLL